MYYILIGNSLRDGGVYFQFFIGIHNLVDYFVFQSAVGLLKDIGESLRLLRLKLNFGSYPATSRRFTYSFSLISDGLNSLVNSYSLFWLKSEKLIFSAVSRSAYPRLWRTIGSEEILLGSS